MSVVLKIELSETEYKALSYVAVDPQDWVENRAKDRSRIAIDQIAKEQVEQALEKGTPISGTKEEIVKNADIKSAKQREQERIQQEANDGPDASNKKTTPVYFAKIENDKVTKILELDRSILEGQKYPMSEAKGQTHIVYVGTWPDALEKTKPPARKGRKATGPPVPGTAGSPKATGMRWWSRLL